MKLYLINNICVSIAPTNGAIEVELQTIDGDNPLSYLNKRITVLDGGYNVEVPSQLEIANAYAPLTVQKNIILEQAIVELTLMIGGATNAK